MAQRSEMTRRERITAAVEFRGPDRIPFQHAVFPGAFWNRGQELVDFLNAHPDDFGGRDFTMPTPPADEALVEEYTDAWGSVWLLRRGYTTGEVKRPALDTWDKWPTFQFPPPPDPNYFAALKQQLADPNRDWYAQGGGGSLYETIQWIRGTENLLIDLAEDRQEVHELADRIVEFNLLSIRGCLEAGVDCVSFGDDWGAQDRLLIHPRKWRQFFKPRYKRMFDPIVEAGKHIQFHTDGWTADIWDDLIEIGVNILNPQHHIMPRYLSEQKLAGRVCIRSDLDRQGIIPFGTPEEVRQHVKDTIALFGSHTGGLILHGEVGPEVPMANILAMVEAFEEFGVYPLQWLN